MTDPTPVHIMVAVLPIITLFFLFILAALAIWRKGQRAAMAHRERLAMIEKGLVPPPEVSDVEKALGPDLERTLAEGRRPPGDRFRSMGVITIGVGLALMLMISLSGESPESGVGIGGAVAVLGAAMVVNAYLDRSRSTAYRHGEKFTVPPPPREQPPAM